MVAPAPAGPVGGIYTVDFARPLPGAVDAGIAYAATGEAGQGGFMAVAVARGLPARHRALSALAGSARRNLLSPLAHGQVTAPSGEGGYVVIYPAPPGPSLAIASRPWADVELIEQLLKPAAQALQDLQAKGVTHRAIRPGNLFQAERGASVVLGPAWHAPPAVHQPAWIEPPYSAACLPAGRGDGTIADDVYALGAVMLALALGADPAAGTPEEALLLRKLDGGSFTALAAAHPLPPAIAELLRGMLADDPDHRPPPSLLLNPAAARARRIAARPIRRAQRGLTLGSVTATTSRVLAFALQTEPDSGLTALRTGVVDSWLRRELGDMQLAAKLDDAVRTRDGQAAAGDSRADALLLARAACQLDPLAPLAWRSVLLWPDGAGPALDHLLRTAPEHARTVAEVATTSVADTWSAWRQPRRDAALSHLSDRELRSVVSGDGATMPLRLHYALNPLAPCESPAVAQSWVVRPADLLSGLEQAVPTVSVGTPLVDAHGAAFLSARHDGALYADGAALLGTSALLDPAAQIRLVARLQAGLRAGPLPQLCRWAADVAQLTVRAYHSRSRREALTSTLAQLVDGGQVTAIAELLADPDMPLQDREGFAAAKLRLDSIAAELAALAEADGPGGDIRAGFGHDVAAGVGAMACAVALAFAGLA